MRKRLLPALVLSVCLSTGVVSAADGITVAPFSFAPRGVGEFTPTAGPAAQARWERVNGDWQLHLAKNVPTSEVAAAGAQINGVSGMSTGTNDAPLKLGFTVESGQCGAGAPRFNVRLTDGRLIFLGCSHGDRLDAVVSFTAGTSYTGGTVPLNATIESISIVFDEQGEVNLDDIFVGPYKVGAPNENRSGSN